MWHKLCDVFIFKETTNESSLKGLYVAYLNAYKLFIGGIHLFAEPKSWFLEVIKICHGKNWKTAVVALGSHTGYFDKE